MSSVFILEPARWPPSPVRDSPNPDDPGLTPRENYKAGLSRAWLNSSAPANFDLLPPQSTTEQLEPAAGNWSKGSGATLSPREIVYIKETARLEFLERQRLAWQSRTNHL